MTRPVFVFLAVMIACAALGLRAREPSAASACHGGQRARRCVSAASRVARPDERRDNGGRTRTARVERAPAGRDSATLAVGAVTGLPVESVGMMMIFAVVLCALAPLVASLGCSDGTADRGDPLHPDQALRDPRQSAVSARAIQTLCGVSRRRVGNLAVDRSPRSVSVAVDLRHRSGSSSGVAVASVLSNFDHLKNGAQYFDPATRAAPSWESRLPTSSRPSHSSLVSCSSST